MLERALFNLLFTSLSHYVVRTEEAAELKAKRLQGKRNKQHTIVYLVMYHITMLVPRMSGRLIDGLRRIG